MKETGVFSRSYFQKSLCMILFAAMIIGAVFIGTSPAASADFAEFSLADLYEQTVDSTVGITINGTTTGHFGYDYSFQASGSGFIISDDGYVLTNYHVIEDADSVTVATYDNEAYDAEIIGYDRDSDIAVLKIDAKKLKPVTLGDSDKLRVGESVYAIGNPLGELTFSLTHGIVSALSRDIKTGSGTSMNLIQTDCAINSGNSGGALFNSRGEVIGITNAKYSSSGYYDEAEIDNVCFAIPVNSVRNIVNEIIKTGNVVKPYIGVTVSPLSEEISGITGIKAGALVQSVIEGAPADQAGIKVNDIIVKVDDTDIEDSDALARVISGAEPGDVMSFGIYRQGKTVELDVKIGSRTTSALKDDEKAEELPPVSQEQPQEGKDSEGSDNNPFEELPPQEQPEVGNEEIPDWSDFSIEDFFNYFFGQ